MRARFAELGLDPRRAPAGRRSAAADPTAVRARLRPRCSTAAPSTRIQRGNPSICPSTRPNPAGVLARGPASGPRIRAGSIQSTPRPEVALARHSNCCDRISSLSRLDRSVRSVTSSGRNSRRAASMRRSPAPKHSCRSRMPARKAVFTRWGAVTREVPTGLRDP